MCPVGSGGVSTRTPGAGRQLYKGTRAGGAWGAGIPLVPAGAHPHTGLRAHLPRMNIPARHSLARIGLPHPGNITAPSHLLLEDQPEVPPPSCHSSPTHCAASFPRATGGTVRGLREVAGTQPQVLRTRSPAAARGVWVYPTRLWRAELGDQSQNLQVTNDPSASLTQRPGADQQGSCHWKSGHRPTATLQELIYALGQGLSQELGGSQPLGSVLPYHKATPGNRVCLPVGARAAHWG